AEREAEVEIGGSGKRLLETPFEVHRGNRSEEAEPPEIDAEDRDAGAQNGPGGPQERAVPSQRDHEIHRFATHGQIADGMALRVVGVGLEGHLHPVRHAEAVEPLHDRRRLGAFRAEDDADAADRGVEPHPLRGDHPAFAPVSVLLRALRAAAAIPLVSRPMPARSSSLPPCSMNRSGIPRATTRGRAGRSSASISRAMNAPKPFVTWPSSTVTTRGWLRTISWNTPRS